VPEPPAAKAGVPASLRQPASATATSRWPRASGGDGPRASGSRPTPPPCPSGWQTGPPDYVGVGVHGAGVSWWSRLVAAHPSISSTGTELCCLRPHWDREFGDQEINLYHQHFPRPAGIIAGEWNPYYIHDWWAAPRLRRAAPDARLLVLLRDPLARLQADLAEHLARGPKASARVLSEAAKRGQYAALLSSLTKHFPPEQVQVLQFERCLADPAGQLVRTFRFLGLDSSPGPALDRAPGPAGEPGPPAGRLPEDLRDVLVATYRCDARTLADEWPGIDLELWPSVR
jgi:Sulfotransferase family